MLKIAARSISTALLMCASAMPGHAAPFIPATDEVILERLRERPLDAATRELRALRADLARDPRNLALATRIARRYIERGRALGDPRYLGYAQSALNPWWSSPDAPLDVLVLRATIRQSNHDFAAAIADLDRVLKSAPDNGQAWLTRATILQVRGEYAEAERSCERLSSLAAPYIAAACRAGVASMTGRAEESYALLEGTLQQMSAASPAEKVWLQTGLAEIAVRLGRRDAAETHFRRSLQHDANDPYLKAAYADFLLDNRRPAEVIRLLENDVRIDALALRLALAARALDAPDLPARIADLQARFGAARARGDRVHLREEARFYLALLDAPGEALRLAKENWTIQREPADARLLLDAALAAKDLDAARPVLDWMRLNRVQDEALARLAKRTETR